MIVYFHTWKTLILEAKIALLTTTEYSTNCYRTLFKASSVHRFIEHISLFSLEGPGFDSRPADCPEVVTLSLHFM